MTTTPQETAPAACERCGHEVVHQISSRERAGRLIGRKPERRQCAADTDHGWPCACRSRAHSA